MTASRDQHAKLSQFQRLRGGGQRMFTRIRSFGKSISLPDNSKSFSAKLGDEKTYSSTECKTSPCSLSGSDTSPSSSLHGEVLGRGKPLRRINRELSLTKLVPEERSFDFNSPNAVDVAARVGDLESIRALTERAMGGGSKQALNWSLEHGFLHVSKWLSENRTEGCTSFGWDSSAIANQMETVKWLHMCSARNEGFSSKAMDRCALLGLFEMVQFLDSVNAGCTVDAMNNAACKGHLNIVRFLHSQGGSCTRRAMNEASKNGYIDVVRWLHENRSEGCSPQAVLSAARNGHVDVVRYLVTHYRFDVAAVLEVALKYEQHEVAHFLKGTLLSLSPRTMRGVIPPPEAPRSLIKTSRGGVIKTALGGLPVLDAEWAPCSSPPNSNSDADRNILLEQIIDSELFIVDDLDLPPPFTARKKEQDSVYLAA